jgi:hypothetical protein
MKPKSSAPAPFRFLQLLFGKPMRNHSKGFIGPIGDDLPSLIPIMVALIVFFTIFATTLATFNSKNSIINKQVEMTSVARELKGDSLLLNVADFQSKCNGVRVKRYPYNFIAAIYPSDRDLSKAISNFASISSSSGGISSFTPDDLYIFNEKNTEGDYVFYYCNYQQAGSKPFTGKEKQFAMKYYPIAVQTKIADPAFIDDETKRQYVIVPGIMALVVWE